MSDISDHLPIFLYIGKQLIRPKAPKTRLTRQINDEKINKIKATLNQLDWNILNYMNTNESHSFFLNPRHSCPRKRN